YEHNGLYRSFVRAIGADALSVTDISHIPFLPISFFKGHEVITTTFNPEIIFESSGTTHTGNSRHLVRSVNLYRKSFIKAFEIFYGKVTDWCIVGLLPSYLERQHSSLVMMVDELITLSNNADSAFYLYEHEMLAALLKKNERAGKKTLLIGVTFALLDFSEAFPFPMQHTVVMETGGMKGRKKEITREEVHSLLTSAWGLDSIHSEYGMTELLSQAYSDGNGLFKCPPWMKIILREEDDPLTIKLPGNRMQNGLVNVIDLANVHSCSFIATDDLGRLHADGSFEIAGRMDSSDVRGCSLMYA
nr:acyl transferase [Chitinophagaceae bacterium]